MQLTNALAFFSLSGLVAATCYGSGADWPSQDEAAVIAQSSCANALIGHYGPYELKEDCVSTITGSINFAILHIRDAEREIGLDECVDGLKKEIACSKGGETSYTNWGYRYVSECARIVDNAVLIGCLLTPFLVGLTPTIPRARDDDLPPLIRTLIFKQHGV